ncbi:MAG TPA: oligosaccharide flippase family protein [Anaerolineales bacterium]|jgi:O-antigen/teichoic acid export membrane protein|nr:oligosaccharide flippase family protein [Anaerolineales bacterium]
MQISLAKIGRNSIVAGLGMLFSGPLSFLVSVWLTRWLGTDQYGVYTLLLTISGVVCVFSSMGIPMGVARYIAHYLGLNEFDKAAATFRVLTCIAAVLSVFSTVGLWQISPWIASLLQKPGLDAYLKTIAVTIPALVMQDVWLYTLRGLQKIGRQTLIEKIAAPVLMAALTLAFFLLHFNLQAYLYGVAALNYLIAGYLGWTTWLQFHNSRHRPIQQREVFEWLGYSAPVLLEKLIQLFLVQAGIEIFLIARYGTLAEVGIYSFAYRVVPFMMLPASAFSIAFGPTIAALYAQRDTNRLQHNFAIVNRWIAILTLPLFLLLVIWSKRILGLSGSQFVSGQFALCVLASGFLVDALVGEVRGIMLMTGRSGMFLLNSGGLMVLNLVLNLYLVPKWGITGAAIAGAISRGLLNLIGLAQVFVFLRIHPFNREYLKTIGAALIASAVYLLALLVIPGQGMGEMLWRSTISMIAYLSSIVVLGLPKEELSAIGFVRKHTANAGYINAPQ